MHSDSTEPSAGLVLVVAMAAEDVLGVRQVLLATFEEVERHHPIDSASVGTAVAAASLVDKATHQEEHYHLRKNSSSMP